MKKKLILAAMSLCGVGVGAAELVVYDSELGGALGGATPDFRTNACTPPLFSSTRQAGGASRKKS